MYRKRATEFFCVLLRGQVNTDMLRSYHVQKSLKAAMKPVKRPKGQPRVKIPPQKYSVQPSEHDVFVVMNRYHCGRAEAIDILRQLDEYGPEAENVLN